jgi:hypothetical protein
MTVIAASLQLPLLLSDLAIGSPETEEAINLGMGSDTKARPDFLNNSGHLGKGRDYPARTAKNCKTVYTSAILVVASSTISLKNLNKHDRTKANARGVC